jgi:hypothetical protein
MPSRDDKTYAKCFEGRSYGHALFKEVVDAKLKPGDCGFFDLDGDWHTILQLTNKDAVAARPDLTPLAELDQQSSEEGPWGPIVSEGVAGHQIDLNVEGKYVNSP